jgi:hypothetical protein
MGDDSIDTVISHIDMEYLSTLLRPCVQGDGTAAILAGDPRVYTLSVHCTDNFPTKKATSTRDVSLPKGGDQQLSPATSSTRI